MKHEKLTAISLFSGCGGMDLGFVREGFDILWAVDNDYQSCETYRSHFGNRIVNRDIIEIDFSKVPDCDVILGGFPCQDFSVIWNRPGIHGKRGDLYRHFVRAVIAKRPKAFVAENVKGLLSANKGMAYSKIVSDFEKVGYKVNSHVYNFADYGVPQIRQRLIIVGIRNDLQSVFIPPTTTHGNNHSLPYLSAGKALRGINKIIHNNERMNIAEKTKKMLQLIPPGGNFSNVPKSSPYYVKGMISHVYRRLHKDKPAYTIIAAGGGGTWSYHHSEPRPLTNRERARLQTFPDNFVFSGSVSDVRKQIGNAVPPEGVKPIARELKNILMGKVKHKSKTIESFLPKKSRKNQTYTINTLDWWIAEKKCDKKRKALQKSANIMVKLGLPNWRGIESYTPNEINELLSEEKIVFFKAFKDLIKNHVKFYDEYYGKNGNLNPRMNQCEYNLNQAKVLLEQRK